MHRPKSERFQNAQDQPSAKMSFYVLRIYLLAYVYCTDYIQFNTVGVARTPVW